MLINLSEYLGVIEVSGEESNKYLQGQITNDINILDQEGKSFIYAAHLNPKGRILASFIITKSEPNTYYLILPLDIIESIAKRLSMFILRAKVKLRMLNNKILFSDNSFVKNQPKELVVESQLMPDFYLAIFNDSLDLSNLQDLSNDLHFWKLFLIEHGISFVYKETQEVLIPQQLNYEDLQAISFTKGCYTGQEIVARTHYLGKIKKRTFIFNSSTEAHIGDKIYSPVLDNQEVGVIVEVIENGESDYLGLACIQTNCVESAYLDKENQHKLALREINYLVEK